MRKIKVVFLLLLAIVIAQCERELQNQTKSEPMEKEKKKVIYQVFTRLFGNDKTTNKPWGTVEENGVGKFNDFTDKALEEIRDLGVTHIWYTGILHHAMVADYKQYGISDDDPDVVKGRAGSPYAVKDYYNVDPDLAVDPANRLEEFDALVERTHAKGMKVIIDIVPNHIARRYEGSNNPKGVSDFGAHDDTSIAYRRDNNFYYIVGESFKVPEWPDNYRPLGGEAHPLADGLFEEVPAKWTGNGSRLAQPHHNDWYETVKINYGIRPDGTKDFDLLPAGFESMDHKAHFEFWADKEVPDSWKKFRDIAHFWLQRGVDGLRYDMAEMVPVEFWSYLNSSIKMSYPDALLLAEVYQPHLYRDYIRLGKMDYLYDKVGLYDSIKHVMQGHGWTDHLPVVQREVEDIAPHMLHFLENHDEQRIASPDFAGSAMKGKPAMLVSATLSASPTLIYFGQEVGEPGAEDAGYGDPTRTSIYDYIGVPHHQRWMNHRKFDGGLLLPEEKELRDFYRRLLNFTLQSDALTGNYFDLHGHNRYRTDNYNHRVFSFARWTSEEQLVVVANFDEGQSYSFTLEIPSELIRQWDLQDGNYPLAEMLYGETSQVMRVADGVGRIDVTLQSLSSLLLQLEKNK